MKILLSIFDWDGVRYGLQYGLLKVPSNERSCNGILNVLEPGALTHFKFAHRKLDIVFVGSGELDFAFMTLLTLNPVQSAETLPPHYE